MHGVVPLTVRNITRDTHDILVQRAARSGRSLQEYLRVTLTNLAAEADVHDVLSRGEARLRATGGPVPDQVILSHRDADRR